jgi:hypothetical protein
LVKKTGPPSTVTGAKSNDESQRLCLIGVKVAAELKREIDAYAHAQGITRSRAASEYLDIGRETLRERDGVPVGRADDLLEVLESVRLMLEILGPPTFGILSLLAHWAARSEMIKVSEDELLAEVRAVVADEWEQAIAEAERELKRSEDLTATLVREWAEGVAQGFARDKGTDE